MEEVASKLFSWVEQRQFALVSGDYNPVHMDDVAARRTQAGKAVVHGMHLALWAIDRLIAEGLVSMPIARFRGRFSKMVYVGETVSLWVVRNDRGAVGIQLRVGNVITTTLSLLRGEFASRQYPVMGKPIPKSEPEIDTPADLNLEELNGKSGRVPFASGADAMFPSAASALGAARIQAIGTISRLVGMVCPGLHSIACSYDVIFTEDVEEDSVLNFDVEEVDERFRLLTQTFYTGGLKGAVVAIARIPPIAQPRMSAVAKSVTPGEFSGMTALVIGGSRGLGELTAKIVAAGGASVTITYAVGHGEALAVCEEIRGWGGVCEVIQYDARKSAAGQLDALTRQPSHLFYFATNAIFTRVDAVFSKRIFEDFCQFYVTAFYDLCTVVLSGCKQTLQVFYPSSEAVTERPGGMTEYAMAKGAGEALCEDMNRSMPILHIEVARLPRILTDQTATTAIVDTADALEVMLPLVRSCRTPIS